MSYLRLICPSICYKTLSASSAKSVMAALAKKDSSSWKNGEHELLYGWGEIYS